MMKGIRQGRPGWAGLAGLIGMAAIVGLLALAGLSTREVAATDWSLGNYIL